MISCGCSVIVIYFMKTRIYRSLAVWDTFYHIGLLETEFLFQFFGTFHKHITYLIADMIKTGYLNKFMLIRVCACACLCGVSVFHQISCLLFMIFNRTITHQLHINFSLNLKTNSSQCTLKIFLK